MKLGYVVAAIVLYSMSASSMAYLSRDGTKLANGSGDCKVCPSGWRPTDSGNYDCGSPVTSEANCRPAVMGPRNPGNVPPVYYDSNGRQVRDNREANRKN